MFLVFTVPRSKQRLTEFLGRISRKVLARSQAQIWDFCLKLLDQEYFTWAHGLSLNGFHERSQSQLWMSHWLKYWDWLKVGLSFVNKGSNMAAIILSWLQNLKWLKIGYPWGGFHERSQTYPSLRLSHWLKSEPSGSAKSLSQIWAWDRAKTFCEIRPCFTFLNAYFSVFTS